MNNHELRLGESRYWSTACIEGEIETPVYLGNYIV